MSSEPFLTITQVAAHIGVPAWKIRRVVDSLGVDVQRAGLYRLIPPSMLNAIADELERQGWRPEVEENLPLQPTRRSNKE